MFEHEEEGGGHSKGTAFLLWLAWMLGFCGLHRFYLRKPWTGLLWLFTFGLFGIGQLVDLFRIPSLVDAENRRQLPTRRAMMALPAKPRDPHELEVELARAAARRGGSLSVAQAVVDIGVPFKQAEGALDAMLRAGYVDIGNDEDSGTVIYRFGNAAALG
jgi:hypothetical protein